MPLSMLAPLPGEVLMRFGAKLNYYIQTQHQWWRFVTPMFLHVNLLHLMVNMYSLWIVGPYVEKLYGSAKFVVFWVLTGVAGVVASYLTVRPDLAVGPIGAFHFQSYRRTFCGSFGRAVRAGWSSVCFWHQVSSRVAGRFQARFWHRLAADDLAESVHRLRGAWLH